MSTMRKLYRTLIVLFTISQFFSPVNAQTNSSKNTGRVNVFSKYRNFPTNWWADYGQRNNDWFKSDEAITIANNIISWQTPEGGWPLMNTTNEPWTGNEDAIGPWGRTGTFVGATTNEIRFLARIYQATNEEKFKQSFLKGLQYIYVSQTPTGGWAKAYPLKDNDYKQNITFNDGAMINVMNLLKEVETGEHYSFLDSTMKDKVKRTFDLGLDCILKCQIVTNSKLTAWCQQHNRYNYQPAGGRTFEPAAISGSESIGIIKLLMDIDHPSLRVKKAIEGAVQWVEDSKIKGYKVNVVTDSTYKPKGIDVKLVPDPGNVMWARYYEIDTNKPIFLGRDGIKKYNLSEIDQERRTGYAWYGKWGANIEQDYANWAAKWGIDISDSTKKHAPRDGYFITSDSVRIHYLTKGEGSPVILIHGLSGTAYGNWFKNGVADSLAKYHFVVALDCRNHGLSDSPDGGGLAWGSAEDVIELMDHLDIKKAHLHGYSMGGGIVAHLMAQVPERIITASMGGYGILETDSTWIAKIPPESKGHDPQSQEAYAELLKAYTESKGMSEKETEDFINKPRTERPRLVPPKLDIDLTKVDFPVMAIIGEFDHPNAKSHRMQRELKNFKLVILAGKSHNTAIMAGYMPQLYLDSLEDFINRNDI